MKAGVVEFRNGGPPSLKLRRIKMMDGKLKTAELGSTDYVPDFRSEY